MAKRGNNEGTIYKRADGRWTAVVTIRRAKGTPRRKQFYGRTRQEAARKLTEALKATKDAVPIPSDRITVAGYARDWLAGIKMSKRPKTY